MSDDFLTRFGLKPPQPVLGREEIPDTLRAGLWDAVRLNYLSTWSRTPYRGKTISGSRAVDHSSGIWYHFFRESTDTIPHGHDKIVSVLRGKFFDGDWGYIYSFIEFLPTITNRKDGEEENSYRRRNFIETCNYVFRRENAALRFADDILVEVTNEYELTEVADAIAKNSSVAVREHIVAGARLLTGNPPNFRNSVKESISAVEAAVFHVTGRKWGKFSDAMAEIRRLYNLHAAFSESVVKLFGYTSNQDGIRHAMLELDNVTQEEAKYMLVSCSAFSNYLLSLHALQNVSE